MNVLLQRQRKQFGVLMHCLEDQQFGGGEEDESDGPEPDLGDAHENSFAQSRMDVE